VIDGFWYGGFGVVVLLCGVGKIFVGVGAMACASVMILILVMNMVLVC